MSATIPAASGTNIERCFAYGGLGRLRLRRLADFERIDPDRLGDVLELGRAQIAHGKIEPRLHLPIGVLGKTDGAGLGDAFQSRGDIDAVAHQIAVALLDHVAEMDADAELDAALGRKAGVALDHTVLHLDGAAHGIDHAAELNDGSVAGALDHAPIMDGDGRVDQIAAQRSQPRQCAILVGASKPAVSDHIRHQNRREFPGLGHGVPPVAGARLAHRVFRSWPEFIESLKPMLSATMSVRGPSRQISHRNQMSVFGVRAEVAHARSK